MAGSEYNKVCSTLITDACLIFLHKSPKILSMRAKKTCLILKRNINEVKRNGPVNYPKVPYMRPKRASLSNKYIINNF